MTAIFETPKQAARRLMTFKIIEGFEPNGFYTYHDLESKPLYWRVRLRNPQTEEKAIRPMRLVNNIYELKEPQFADGKPLYNLHLIARNVNEKVFIVEGEKCADRLVELGLIAVTSGGATSAKDADWQVLTGRSVIIWPDNDEAGLQYANDISELLKNLHANLEQIDINLLNLPPKGDCYDWLKQFEAINNRIATKEDVRALQLKKDEYIQATNKSFNANDANLLIQSEDELIVRLAKLTFFEYDRIRAENAKRLNVRPSTLDMLVKAERTKLKTDHSPFAEIEPWHEPVNPWKLLDTITQTIQRFIVLDKHQAQTAALWLGACWFINEISFAPFALINAPEKACGKTQLLTLMGKLAPRTLQASGISPAALYRTIEKYQPTLFIDEIETVLKDNEPLRGIFNAGYSRDSSIIVRCVGDDLEPRPFNIWGMKAIAGINASKLSDTVTSRSIVIELRRKTASERVERLRHAEPGLFEKLASQLARFAQDYVDAVKQARPALPDALGDRDQDNWEPLLQIASVAGGQLVRYCITSSVNSF